MPSNYQMPDQFPSVPAPVPDRRNSAGKIIAKIFLFIFSLFGFLAIMISIIYFAMPDNPNSGGSVWGDGIGQSIGFLFLIIAGIFLGIAAIIHFAIRPGRK